jgi:hypothetical protein
MKYREECSMIRRLEQRLVNDLLIQSLKFQIAPSSHQRNNQTTAQDEHAEIIKK